MEVSGCEIPSDFAGGDKVADAVLDDVPVSDPFAEAAELGAPPALTELSEYMEDTDIRFESRSDVDGLDRNAGSGSCTCFASSAIVPCISLGVSKSSTAKSSLLVLLLGVIPGPQEPAVREFR